MTSAISDQVPRDNPGAREIGFAIPERYNAGRILFDNPARGHGDRLALTGPAGNTTYNSCSGAAAWPMPFTAKGTRSITAQCPARSSLSARMRQCPGELWTASGAGT